MKKGNFWLLLAILLLATLLRLWQLGSNPAGFFCDEASIGYNAYSLLETGRDEHGNPWPLFFRAFGEYKNPVMIYSTVPFVAILGLNEFSVRLASAVYGILGVLAIYFLGKEIFGSETGLFSALFLAISPWHVHLSRVALEGQMSFVFFTTLAIYFWLKNWREAKGAHHPRMAFANLGGVFASIVLFALALYSYFPARIFIPLFALGLMIIELRGLLKQPNKFLMGMALTVLLVAPMVGHFFSGSGLSRWHQVKGERISTEVVGLYLNHFSPDFLFTKGDIDFPGQFITRHSVRGMGELHLFQLPIILSGLFILVKNFRHRQREVIILFSWLLFYPLGSIFTLDVVPQATRSIIGVVPFQIISAFGLIQSVAYLKEKSISKKFHLFLIYLSITILIIAFSSIYYFNLLNQYPSYSSDYWGWQSGPREIINYFLAHQEEYDQLIMTGEFNAPYIFLKFYGQNQCHKCTIGNFSLIDKNKKQLFAVKPNDIEGLENHNYEFLVKKEIFYPDNQIAFIIGQIIIQPKFNNNEISS